MFVTHGVLDQNPNYIFVFGDNTIRRGMGGAAMLRNHPQSYGFITKKFPNNDDKSFYKPGDYKKIFNQELTKLIVNIEANPDKIFLISKLGGGLGNRYKIFENVIKPGLEVLNKYENVKFLY